MLDETAQKTLVDNLRWLLTTRNLYQEQLAISANISSSHISDILHCKTSVTLVSLEKLANALDVPLSYLLTPRQEWQDSASFKPSLPQGFRWIAVALPEYQAFLVEKWSQKALKDIRLQSKQDRKKQHPINS